jgi:hypothetical protein
MKFRKKPVVIEAWQFKGGALSAREILTQLGPKCGVEHRHTSNAYHPHILVIQTLEGEMRATEGDWIIRGVKGEYYPCKPDIFEATYEKVDE